MHPIHIIMGAADHQRINKTESAVSRENSDKDPGVEMTMFGWTFTGKSINTSGEVAGSFRTSKRQLSTRTILNVQQKDQKV